MSAAKQTEEIDEAIAEAIRIREAMEEQIDELNVIAAKLSAQRTILLLEEGADAHCGE